MTETTPPAVWIDGDPLMEAIASTVWEQCARDDEDMPHAVCDDPRTIAAWAAAVARSHAAAVPAPATDRAALRDRIADLLAAADGWKWVDGFDKARSPAYQGYQERAAAVLAGLPACSDPIECEHEAALGEAQQQVRRLGLMVDEYGAGASALTGKLKRVRDMHRETCPVAQGVILPPAASCSLCEVLDAPAAAVSSAPGDRAAFVPPAAECLPPGALDSATDGASALDAWARDPHGRNFLAHALVQLARDGWLRTEPGDGFEVVRDRETPEPQDPAALRRMADETPQPTDACPDCAHRTCDGNGPCGAILSVGALSENRCPCPGAPAVVAQPDGEA
jgi:hypothetical protein